MTDFTEEQAVNTGDGQSMASAAKYREAERAFWRHCRLEPRDGYVDLSTVGTRVRVQEVGEGDPVVLLHGSPTAGTTFAPLIQGLDGFRCLIPDVPPGGLSDPFAVTADNVATVVGHLVTDLLDALGLERAHMIASSSGSAFAMHAGLRAPERVGGVVHLGSPWLVSGIAMPATEKILLMPGVRGLMAWLTPNRKMQVSMLKSIGHADSIAAGRIPDVYWEWYDALMRETDTYRPQMRVLPAFKGKGLSYDPRLMIDEEGLRAQGPTLVIWGSDEKLATMDDARSLVGRIPGASLEVVEGAGHLPWLDFPEQVADSTRKFLEGVG